jgi:hypothetical protein
MGKKNKRREMEREGKIRRKKKLIWWSNKPEQ